VVNLTIETNSETKAILANQLTTLEEQIRERVQSQTHVAIHDGIAP
jgi:phenylpyruvate tautomerase PptA (4-oxalocrotonate tautomerase family)